MIYKNINFTWCQKLKFSPNFKNEVTIQSLMYLNIFCSGEEKIYTCTKFWFTYIICTMFKLKEGKIFCFILKALFVLLCYYSDYEVYILASFAQVLKKKMESLSLEKFLQILNSKQHVIKLLMCDIKRFLF